MFSFGSSSDSFNRFILLFLLLVALFSNQNLFSAELGTYSLDCDAGKVRYPFKYYDDVDSSLVFLFYNNKGFEDTKTEADVVDYTNGTKYSDYETFYSSATSTTTGHVFTNVIRTTTYTVFLAELVGPSSQYGYNLWDVSLLKKYTWTGCYSDQGCQQNQVFDFETETCVLQCSDGFVLVTDVDSGEQTCVQECSDSGFYFDSDFDICVPEGTFVSCDPNACVKDPTTLLYTCSYSLDADSFNKVVFKSESTPCAVLGDFDDVKCDPEVDFKCGNVADNCGIGQYYNVRLKECLDEDSTYLCDVSTCKQVPYNKQGDVAWSCKYKVVSNSVDDSVSVDLPDDYVDFVTLEKCDVMHSSPEDNNVTDITGDNNCGIGYHLESEINGVQFTDPVCLLDGGVYVCKQDSCSLVDGVGYRCVYDVYQDSRFVESVSYSTKSEDDTCVLSVFNSPDSNSSSSFNGEEIDFGKYLEKGVDVIDSQVYFLDSYFIKILELKDELNDQLSFSSFSFVPFPTVSFPFNGETVELFSESKYQAFVPFGFDSYIKSAVLFLAFFSSLLMLLKRL